ncbi:MAG: hypothetical protein ACREM2_11550 [Vulcanimicrobiaceae bacterium]
MRRSRLLAAVAAAASALLPLAAGAALSPPAKAMLGRYLAALEARDYAAAFALLSADERRYYGTPAHFASIFTADQLAISHARIVGSVPDPPRGTLAIVLERVGFLDHANGARGSATVKVVYGVLTSAAGLRIHDPGHPWMAFDPSPAVAAAENAGIRAVVRKLSFFTGRVEAVVTFENRAATTVTLLPLGRSTMRDQLGRSFAPIDVLLPALTDQRLKLGVRLAPQKEYTGFLDFATAARFAPRSLAFSFGPLLFDGGDAPFDVAVGPFEVPP